MEIKGTYCKDCKIFTENVENEALKLIYNICNHPVFKDSKIRIMPDTHAGKGIVIGFSAPIGVAVAPAHVGCDIGCSMTTIKFDNVVSPNDFALLEHKIKESIPMGFNLNEKSNKENEKILVDILNTEYNKARSAWSDMIPNLGCNIDERFIKKMCERLNMDLNTFYQSLGTVGGGNHFLEYGEYDGKGFFTIHCGSRNFGVKVFNYWNKKANNQKISKDAIKKITENVKKNCNDKKEWHSLIAKAKEDYLSNHCNGYLYNDDLRGYLSDMVIAQAYASANHKIISSKICQIMNKFGLCPTDTIKTTHNYIDFSDKIIRKGAINANKGQLVIIPFNMRDGIAICTGKGNDDWNCTAPHGAGRIMSRSKAKNELSMDMFKNEMKNVYSTTVCEGTLDESPMAYKDTNEILELIKPTVDVLYMIKPKINIKATDGAE